MEPSSNWPLRIPQYLLHEQNQQYQDDLQYSFDHDFPIVAPIFGVIVLTRHCESACIYCPYHHNTFNFNSDYIPFEQAIHYIDQLISIGVKRLQLSGGDPLLHPGLYDVINYSKAQGLKVNIVTSATRLTYQVAQKLVDAGLDGLVVSIDSQDPVLYKLLRGRSSEFLSNALEVLQWMRSHTGIWIGVNCVVTCHNIEQVPELVERIDEYGFWTQTQLVHSFTPQAENQHLKPSIEQVASLVSSLQFAKRKGLKVNHSDRYLNGMLYWTREGRFPPDFCCPMGYLEVLVDVDGEIRLCCMLPNGGSLKTSNLNEIWVSEAFQEQRKAIHQKHCPQCWLMLVDLWK